MVTCQLSGGFGNQLCQVSAVIAYALKHDMPFCIPPKTADPAIWAQGYFGKPLPIYEQQLAEALQGTKVKWLDYENRDWIWHSEPDNQAYKEIPAYPYVQLRGHFQSYKYWQDEIGRIRHAVFPALTYKNSCAIHVRRGDYLKFPVKHPVVTIKYIYDAMHYLFHKGIKKFEVYSDDMPWCKDAIGGHLQRVFDLLDVSISFPEPGATINDFISIMSCEHHIISPSSYSLMAAHMRMNPNGVVIAPAVWTLEPKQIWDTTDIIPPTWIKI